MSKTQKRIDINQGSIFDLLQAATEQPAEQLPGSLDIDRQFREAISLDLKGCTLSRYGVAARMSELTGQEITAAMLNSWTAEKGEAE